MKKLATILLVLTASLSCAQGKYLAVDIKTDLHTPTARIDTVTLITNNLSKDSANAQALIHAKVLLPLAMQQHSQVLFDSVLATGFLYHEEGVFFNREEYIRDRVNGQWTITDVQYENVVLQFYKEHAVLTYRNTVKENDEHGKPQIFEWFWADIWVQEKGRWKLKELRALN